MLVFKELLSASVRRSTWRLFGDLPQDEINIIYDTLRMRAKFATEDSFISWTYARSMALLVTKLHQRMGWRPVVGG